MGEFNAVTATCSELLDHAIEEIKMRGDQLEEAWELIDGLIPYVRLFIEEYNPYLVGPCQVQYDLLLAIEEKRRMVYNG